jgi:cytoskeletal protein RodZ
MENNEELNETLFEKLKAIRIKKNIELEKIAQKTRINIKYLEAIESGNIKNIPEVYDKLFFQTYLSSLNVKNPDEYLDAYYKIRKEARPQYTTTIQKINSIKTDTKRFTKLKQIYLIIPILIVVVLIVFFAMNSRTVIENDMEEVPELSVREIANEIEQKMENDSAAQKAKQGKIEKNKMVDVKISTKELTWMRLVKDRMDTSEYLLKPGNNLTVNADSTLVFLIGNAGGVSFNINGKEAGAPGNSSEIVSYMKITSKGIVEKRLKKATRKEAIADTLISN